MNIVAIALKEFSERIADIGAILAAAAGIYAVGRKIAKTGRAAVNTHEKIVALTEKLTPATVDAIVTIAYQLKPNGGSSLHDKISRIEAELLRENAVRRQQICATGLAFWESDSAGKVVFASAALGELIGTSTEDILGNGWVTNLHPEDREQVFAEWEAAVQQKRAFFSTYRFLHRDGQSVLVQGRSHPILDRNGGVLGHVGTLTPA
jgi:PAS domain S-box-containing protein